MMSNNLSDFTILVQRMLHRMDVAKQLLDEDQDLIASTRVIDALEAILTAFGEVYYSDVLKRYVLFMGERGAIYYGVGGYVGVRSEVVDIKTLGE